MMVGPQSPPPGGIASVIDTIVGSELGARFEIERFPTTPSPWQPSGGAERLFNAALCRLFGFEGFISLETRAWMRSFHAALERDWDIAHIHVSSGYDFWLGSWMAQAAGRRGIRTVLHTHGVYSLEVPRWSRLRRVAFRRMLQIPDHVVVLSDGWKRWFEDWMEAERMLVLRNPVDVRRVPARVPRDVARSSARTRQGRP